MKRYTYYVTSWRADTGITNSIYRRALQHKRGEIEGFTKRYNINRPVYYEVFHHVGNAIAREKQSKSWTRARRIAADRSKKSDLARPGERFELQIPRSPEEFENSSGFSG